MTNTGFNNKFTIIPKMKDTSGILIPSVVFALILLLMSSEVIGQVFTNKEVGKKNEELIDSLKVSEYPYVLPIWGAQATAKGYSLPYSAGLSVQYFGSKSDLVIDNLKVGFNNGPMYDLDGIVRFDKERIEKAFAAEFAKRDINLVTSGGDMVVSLFIVVDEKTSVTAYTNNYGGAGYGYGTRWGWYGGYGQSTTSYSEDDYLEGTLVVDVFDKSDKKLLWQGVGQKTIQEKPEKRERMIPHVAESIMKPFPIKPTAKK